MSHAYLPQQISKVNVTTFNAPVAKTKVLDSKRQRRLFGIVNTDTASYLEVWLKEGGAGSSIKLAPMSAAGKYDGGSLEINGYNGEVWVNLAGGYVYYNED